MKRILLIVLLCISCFFVTAQQDSIGRNFVGAKVLFIDYGRANSVDGLDITNGLEVFYQRNVHKYLSVALPLKAGVANVADDIDNRRIISLDALLHLHLYQPKARIIPYLLGGGGIVWEEFEDYNIQIPVGGGLNIRVGKNSYLNLQGEYRKSLHEDRNNLQGGIGFVYRIGKPEPDFDGDGVVDRVDACPELPGSAETGGCPDQDGDGVADKNDECPETPGVASLGGCPDADGDGVRDRDDQCPDIAGVADLYGCPDTDGDGVADRFDECPEEAGLPANNGCPVSDRDEDGIPDEMDDCPDEAGTKKTGGCPDRDGDGVADADDRCPDTAGQYAGCPDTDGDGIIDPEDRCPEEAGPSANKGCPEIEEEVQEVLDFAMRAVQFETGKAALKEESFGVLNQIAEIMRQYQAYDLRIAGHTDSVGDEASNQVLSEERAKSCYQYLVSQGISPDRLIYVGFGESQPIATNNTREGRRLNRRVQFELFLE
jgi:OOP family OmpA-OmpF porin